ncbi:O-acetylhomoserine (thiol)-lyase [Pseudobutyrivibrio sp. NOR37]|uniref:homocysteine desulfhydrase n=1 Tax=Pseudobutyrivibrio xylanivorans TaxID=185007 RepID=A0A6M0LHN1_PSEXY|nr:aminotransferase class I/II-fold pyridoxal phosphate-dependent enzyme [Pseudobutyrivibrio sp. NOR37]NEX01407.1 O-acetylhomoserine aminocarboxypropyltransferase/cysteine synthase [Pseudobutyrivibrio xylanivorans]SFR67162.1 O-acetylhomoserine (thiol)-lyase [Pseudobutyrivibrio sp. NOR37]
MGFNTDLLHAGKIKDSKGATLPPIYQSSAFEQETSEDLAGIFGGRKMGFCYTRVANPTVSAFEERINKLEGGLASVACASGMAAISMALLNILQAGDEIISSASLYGGSIDLFRDIEAFGIKTIYVKNNDWDEIENAFTDKTKVVFAETIGNPCLDVTDIDKLAEIAHSHGVPLVLDNTTATPYLVKAIEHGADIVVNSSSKYINGSSNSISGILTDSGNFKWTKDRYPVLGEYLKFGKFAFVSKLRNGLYRNVGVCLSPLNAYLNIIGLETLGLRMDRQSDNAYQLAKWFEENYKDIKVNYPGLESSDWHDVAKRVLKNGFGGILTIRVGSKERAFEIMNKLQIPFILSNIGDTKTLVVHPSSTISLHSTEKELEDSGVYDDLIRISVGIEDIDDLIADFKQAIN